MGDEEVSLNEDMIEEGYAWAYDGGTKQRTSRNFVKYEGLSVHLMNNYYEK